MPIDRHVLAASWRAYWSQDMARHGPYWLQIVWTGVIALGFASVFTLIGFVLRARTLSDWTNLSTWAHWFGRNLIVTLTVTVLIHIVFEAAGALIGRERIKRFTEWQRTLFFIGVPMLGLYAGWPIGYWLTGGELRAMWNSGNTIIATLLLSLGISFALSVYWNARHRQTTAEARATEAQLKLLQAQIEPHFLFNTLANVVSLIDHDAPRAKQMLESFIDYLRASLTGLRRADSTLGDELDMARAYLALIGTRMEERLRYDIRASDEARAALLPPLLLQPLIENAIQHGLEPKIDGGQVHVEADVQGGQLRVRVRDDGLGLDAAPLPQRREGGGIGLQNVRARLESRYGNLARLRLDAQSPGVLATLEMPFETAPDTAARP